MHEEAWQGFPQLHCLDLSWCDGVLSNHQLLVACGLLHHAAVAEHHIFAKCRYYAVLQDEESADTLHPSLGKLHMHTSV